MKKDILNINVFNGDDGIKYIRYDDMISMLNRIKEDNEERDEEIERLNSIIKEVREYIKTCNSDVDLYSMFLSENYISNYGARDILEILDKVDKENNNVKDKR